MRSECLISGRLPVCTALCMGRELLGLEIVQNKVDKRSLSISAYFNAVSTHFNATLQ